MGDEPPKGRSAFASGRGPRCEPAALGGAALEAVLESLAAPAALVSPAGRVGLANAAARGLFYGGRAGRAALVRAAAGREPGFEALPLPAPGAGWLLVVGRGGAGDVSARTDRFARRIGLTRRQGEALALLVRGRSNREIAATLGCAVGTAELHVSAILRKAGCAGRTEVVARVLGEGA